MKATSYLAIAVVGLTFAFGQQAVSRQQATTQQKSAVAQSDSSSRTMALYRCPMDKDVVAQNPGKCPRCGMKLEKVAMQASVKKAGSSAKAGCCAGEAGSCDKPGSTAAHQ